MYLYAEECEVQNNELDKLIWENEEQNFILKQKTNRNIKSYLVNALKEMKQKGLQDTNYRIINYKYCSDSLNRDCLYVEFDPCGVMLIKLDDGDILINMPTKETYIDKSESNFKAFGLSHTKSNIKTPRFDLLTLNLSDNSQFENIEFSSFDSSKKIKNEFVAQGGIRKKNKKNKNNKTNNEDAGAANKTKSGIINADVEVPYSWWFKKSIYKTHFGYTDVADIKRREAINYDEDDENQGLCHYVAAGMLLQYMEYFKSSGYFTEEQIKKYITIPRLDDKENREYNLPAFPRINYHFVKDLWIEYGDKKIFTTGTKMAKIIRSFINKKNKNDTPSYKVEPQLWGRIKPWEMIDDETPFMLYSTHLPCWDGESVGHSVVIYGYYYNNNRGGKYLCHYGWDNASQVIVSTQALDWLWTARIDLWKKSEARTPKKYFVYDGQLISGPDYGKIRK